ncbi:MAG: S16 family serine protease, partial [Gemmatimonadota bacterium]
KEKVLGAVRAGIQEVIIPAENDASLEDLPKAVREALTVHLVQELDEVLEHALVNGSAAPPEAQPATVGGAAQLQVE